MQWSDLFSINKKCQHNKVPIDVEVGYCPDCGEEVDVNLRKDNFFVEDAKWHEMSDRYYDFLNDIDGKFVFLEIGVGFNTPPIIRFPFEQMTYNNDDATLIRLNLDYPQAIEENKDKTISFDEDVEEILDYWLSRI
jgi:NAD-dependent SIR2 family protein deacetylase